MDYQTFSPCAVNELGLSRQADRKIRQPTVTQLIDDKAAMDDWSSNIEKIRQKESGGAGRQEP